MEDNRMEYGWTEYNIFEQNALQLERKIQNWIKTDLSI